MTQKLTLTREQIEEWRKEFNRDPDDMYSPGAIEELRALCDMAIAYLDMVKPMLAKHQPCGCVVCTCDDGGRCHGCGARHCGTHLVGKIPNPVYLPTPEGET